MNEYRQQVRGNAWTPIPGTGWQVAVDAEGLVNVALRVDVPDRIPTEDLQVGRVCPKHGRWVARRDLDDSCWRHVWGQGLTGTEAENNGS